MQKPVDRAFSDFLRRQQLHPLQALLELWATGATQSKNNEVGDWEPKVGETLMTILMSDLPLLDFARDFCWTLDSIGPLEFENAKQTWLCRQVVEAGLGPDWFYCSWCTQLSKTQRNGMRGRYPIEQVWREAWQSCLHNLFYQTYLNFGPVHLSNSNETTVFQAI